MPTSVVPPGTCFAHYRVTRQVGEGAMGTVYEAYDTGLDRRVALKVLKPDLANDQERASRFVREARAAAQVRHANLAHIYFVGQEEGRHFFAMELLDGESLDEYVERAGALPLEEALRCTIHAARGLAAAHEAGIVHRDVKPSNIMRQSNGDIAVTDFGLSKVLNAEVALSQEGALVGTPAYMSPEQCLGRDVDARTDTYALALTCWALLTGESPYPQESIGQLLDAQLHQPLPSLRSKHPALPAALDDALCQMAAKDPAQRPASMRDVIALLEACMPSEIRRATFTVRATAFGIDLLGCSLLYLGLALASSRLLGVMPAEDSFADSALFAALLVLTQLLPEIRFQRSLGKWLMNLRVVTEDGGIPRISAMLLRFLIRFPNVVAAAIGFELLGNWAAMTTTLLGLAAILAGLACFAFKQRRTLSDLVTGTRVAFDLAS